MNKLLNIFDILFCSNLLYMLRLFLNSILPKDMKLIINSLL